MSELIKTMFLCLWVGVALPVWLHALAFQFAGTVLGLFFFLFLQRVSALPSIYSAWETRKTAWTDGMRFIADVDFEDPEVEVKKFGLHWIHLASFVSFCGLCFFYFVEPINQQMSFLFWMLVVFWLFLSLIGLGLPENSK